MTFYYRIKVCIHNELSIVIKLIYSRFDSPICSIHNPRYSLSYDLFSMIRNIMGSPNFVAKMATLGNSRNLHKSKMAARYHLEN